MPPHIASAHNAGTPAFSRLLHAAIDAPPPTERKRRERPQPQDA